MEKGKRHALTPDLLKEVKKLHFQTKKLSEQGVSGKYRSAYRGSGMEFEEVREYCPGDDIRAIDWKVTARSRKPYIKSYREERELSVLIAVDVSSSTLTATVGSPREELIAKISAVLSFIALHNNDKIGLLTFSDSIEYFSPPRKAKSSVWRILHEVLGESPVERRRTNLSVLFAFLAKVLKRRAIIFVISDFIDSGYETSLATLAKRHDVTAVVVRDPADTELPRAGLVRFEDPETGETKLVDLSHQATRNYYDNASTIRIKSEEQFLRNQGIGIVNISTDRPFINDLRRYFEQRRR